jgi:Fe-S cluster assembly protein SufD
MTTATELRPPTGSPAERFTSRDPEAFSVPSGREEAWRFTPTRDIRDLFEPFTATGALTGNADAPAGVTAGPVPMDHPAVGRVLEPDDRASALAFAQSKQAFLVQVPAEAQLDAPIVVSAVGAPGRTHAHLVIDCGAFAKATVVIDYQGSTSVVENVEILVGDSATLEVVVIADWDADAVQLSSHAVRVGRDARLTHVAIGLGGRLVRVAPTVRYAGPGGTVRMLGLGFAGDTQHFESRLLVDHSEPNCSSDVLYKNALLGEHARTVWIGDVRIRPTALGTETFELNRNLLLSPGARADSVPNLEIETGEIVGAGHASATGRFDELQLFYLQSRGIPPDDARRLVVRGFFADVINQIGLPDLEARLLAAVEARLETPATPAIEVQEIDQ